MFTRTMLLSLALAGLAWVHVEPAAEEIDRRLEMLDVAEATRHALDLLDLAVEPRAPGIGHRRLVVGPDVGDGPTNRLGGRAHRLQSTVRGPEIPPLPELPA